MPTLQELRQRKFKTIKEFASAYGHSATTASNILHGKHQSTLSQKEVYYLAKVLGVSFEECAMACDASYAEFKGYTEDSWKIHASLDARWRREEKIYQRAKEARDTDDWSEFKRNYRDPIDRLFGPLLNKEAFDLLGIPMNATESQIKQAFRNKVKQAATGNGGYQEDMDKLTRAKEQALKTIGKG